MKKQWLYVKGNIKISFIRWLSIGTNWNKISASKKNITVLWKNKKRERERDAMRLQVPALHLLVGYVGFPLPVQLLIHFQNILFLIPCFIKRKSNQEKV